MSTQQNEAVDHPKHYNQYEGFEVIDVCEQLVGPDGKSGFNLGNAFKYIARAGFKSPEKHVEDLEKAVFYIQREIDRINAEKLDKLLFPKDDESLVVHTNFPDKSTEEDTTTHCPECGILLVLKQQYQPHCPNMHGWLDETNIWHQPFNMPAPEACKFGYLACTNPNHQVHPEDLGDVVQYGLRPEPVIDKSTAVSDRVGTGLGPECPECKFPMSKYNRQPETGTVWECLRGHGHMLVNGRRNSSAPVVEGINSAY